MDMPRPRISRGSWAHRASPHPDLKLTPHVSQSGAGKAPPLGALTLCGLTSGTAYMCGTKKEPKPLWQKNQLTRPAKYYLINSASYLHPYLREIDATHSSRDRAPPPAAPCFPWVHGQPVTGEHALMYACRKLAVDPLHVARIGDGGPAQNGECYGDDRPADCGKKPGAL